ncbi:CBO0543 family protein [Bacillus salipaludis]|uniref:CBO0543 family protein n=1 Tax=Bacillus salipaludis TaxID=2547811 RepID=UPI003AF31D0E
MYTSGIFASFLAAISDIYLDIKLDFYGFFSEGVDWLYLPIFIIIYPAASILLLNFYPFQKSLFHKIIYILGCTLFTTVFEYIALHNKVFYYHQWKLWYSITCYPFLFLILLLHLKLIRKLMKG